MSNLPNNQTPPGVDFSNGCPIALRNAPYRASFRLIHITRLCETRLQLALLASRVATSLQQLRSSSAG
jgi:hypothetical protein